MPSMAIISLALIPDEPPPIGVSASLSKFSALKPGGSPAIFAKPSDKSGACLEKPRPSQKAVIWRLSLTQAMGQLSPLMQPFIFTMSGDHVSFVMTLLAG